MKWFKHITDSLDDPFIFDLVDRFGGDGYLVFFGVLEIYAREYKTKLDWNLTVTRSYLRQKLHKRQATLVEKILKHIGNSGKWEVSFNEEYVTIFIPKFGEMIDDWTQRKLRSNSEVTPKKLNTIKEEDIEEEKDISTLTGTCPQKEIVDLYHEILPELPKVKVWNETRQKMLRQRWKERPERQDMEYWKKFFTHVRGSPFLMGGVKDFTATLPWLVKAENFAKVIEGNYHRG